MTRLNNEDLNEVTWEQRVMAGSARCPATQDIPNFAYARFGEMLRLRGIYVDHPQTLASAWQEALACDRPVVLEVKIEPDVAPLPAHLTLKETRGFMSSIAKGDTAAVGVISETARQVFYGILGRSDPK
jgi:pyruvate dehydrogenase (quinone)